MQTASSPFPNSTSPYPRDLRGASPATAGAGKIYPVNPAAVKKLNAFMASAPPRIRPPLSDEKGVVVGKGRKENAATKAKGATTMEKQKLEKNTARAEAPTAVPSPNQKNGHAPAANLAAIYPAEAIAAAQEQAKAKGRRDLVSVFTPDVLAVWHHWHEEDGRTMAWIAKNNGLLEITTQQVSDYLRKYREALTKSEPETPPAKTAVPRTARPKRPGHDAVVVNRQDDPGQPFTATGTPVPDTDPEPVANEKPETEAMPTAVAPFELEKPENLPTFFDREYRPQPRPGDALAALASLVNSEQLRVKGSVKLNLEIEFGGE